MDNKDKYLNEIVKIETEFSELLNSKLSGYSDEERVITSFIINDAVNLIQDISRDKYLFDVSYENYNNKISFMPQYYFENILLHMDMVWERILIIIAASYQIDFKIIFERKNVNYLYNNIKKDKRVDDEIKKMLNEINADFKMKSFKETRNVNEHYISTHLTANDRAKIDLRSIFSMKNGILVGNLEKISELTEQEHRREMEVLKNNMDTVSKQQQKYIEILKECITRVSRAFDEKSFVLCQKECFLNKDIIEMFVPVNIYELCRELEDDYGVLREKFRSVVNMINENVIAMDDKCTYIRNTLLTDSLFRAKEIIRSINYFNSCVNYNLYSEQYFESECKEKFEKYICNDIIYPYYYYDHAMLKLYSVYEKLAKFLLCKYDIDKNYREDDKFKGMYIYKISELLSNRGCNDEILRKFNKCITHRYFKEYEKERNREYHCLRQVYFLKTEKIKSEIILLNITRISYLLKNLSEIFEMIIEDEINIYTEIQKKIYDKFKL